MKNKERMYFGSIDETMCHPLDWFTHDAKLEGLKEITLVEAIPDNETKDFIWCNHFGDVTERSLCKKSQCEAYSSKSGRGACEHRGNLYSHGEEVTIDVEL